MARRTTTQLLAEAEARVKLETARLQLSRIKLHKEAVKARRVALSTHAAAVKNRMTRDWIAKATSADGAILADSATLNARARQMVRDDAYAKSIVRAFRRNVVGTGIHPAAAARDRNGKALEQFNKAIDALWFDWQRNKDLVDIEGRRNLVAIQRWVSDELVTVGEALIVKSYLPRENHVGLVLQLLEPEQLDMNKLEHGDNEIRGGVEVDEYGKPLAYWVYERHPNDVRGLNRPSPLSLESIRIPADRMIHVCDPDRVRQTRGVTRLAPIMLRLRDVHTTDYAQLLAMKAEACIGMVIKSQMEFPDAMGLKQPVDADGGATREDTDGNDELAMQPLMVARLAPGEEMQSFTPTRPGSSYEPYMKSQLRAVSAGAGISYEQVARDFTNGSYSSQRQAMLEDRREYEPLQEILITSLLQPIWEEFISWAVMESRISAPGYAKQQDMYQYAEWRGQGWSWIDPEKEVNAHEKAITLGIETKTNICLERGLDFREVAAKRAEEVAFEAQVAAKSGVKPLPQPGEEEATTPTDAAAPDPTQAVEPPTDENAGVAVEKQDRLSGIDAQRADEMLGRVSRGESSPEVVRQILIAMGFTEDEARRMIDEAKSFTPAKPDPAAEPQREAVPA